MPKLKTKTKPQLRLAHFLTHTTNYQKKKGCRKARSEHDKIVKLMLRKGMNHNSPFRCLI